MKRNSVSAGSESGILRLSMHGYFIRARKIYSRCFRLFWLPARFCAAKKAFQVLLGVSCVSGAAAISSEDAIDTWQQRNPKPAGPALYGVTYGASNFVAVGYAGAILTWEVGVAGKNRSS